MPGSRSISQRLLALVPIFGFWTLIGLSFAGQFFISSAQLGRPVAWQQALSHSLADWYVFALLSVLPIRLTQRYGLDGPDWGRRFALHFVASALFSVLFVVLRSGVGLWQAAGTGQAIGYAATFEPLLVKTWHFNLMIYWVILSVAHAIEFYRRFQERAARTAELERRLVEARLQALQMQLNPHFLFNTLHAISALMHQDVDAADRMIARLSELLRHALESTDQQEVSLRDEIAFLERYLEIERTRFGDRLQIEIDIPEETAGLRVPNLILQPLVENAIQHGIEPHARPGRVTISARLDGESLVLEVTDTGDGAGTGASDGVGLANTRARLRQLYGDRHQFELEPAGTKGFRAMLRLPTRAG